MVGEDILHTGWTDALVELLEFGHGSCSSFEFGLLVVLLSHSGGAASIGTEVGVDSELGIGTAQDSCRELVTGISDD